MAPACCPRRHLSRVAGSRVALPAP
jgi:hypothetical protein